MTNNKEIERYILEHVDPEDPVLTELDRGTHLKLPGGRMISGHLQGQILTMLSKMIRPERVLELGTFTGYSAICLAKGLQKGGKLITIERNDELESMSAKYIEKAGFSNAIIRLTGPALDIIPTLKETFDLIFIDADKREYEEYYRMVFDKLRSGGYLIADNTLWSGKILLSPSQMDDQTKGITSFNKMIKNDTRVEKVILPIRDGLTLLRKR